MLILVEIQSHMKCPVSASISTKITLKESVLFRFRKKWFSHHVSVAHISLENTELFFSNVCKYNIVQVVHIDL